jgi:hypothetical protein
MKRLKRELAKLSPASISTTLSERKDISIVPCFVVLPHVRKFIAHDDTNAFPIFFSDSQLTEP